MKEREYKGWEIIKLLEERKLKDGTKMTVVTNVDAVFDCIVRDNKIFYYNYYKNSAMNDCIVLPVEYIIFGKSTIKKEIEYMNFQEAVATKKPLRLNKEWSEKLVETDYIINENNEGEEYKLLEAYQNGRYLYIQDMFIVLGWFLPGKDLRELMTSNEKVWYVESEF